MSHKRCNGDVVREGAAERGPRTLRAEGALKAIAAGPRPEQRLRGILEQALVFAGASLAALYTPGDDRELLCLAESAGAPRTLYGVRDSYPASGGSPVADAHRAGEAVWISGRRSSPDRRSRGTCRRAASRWPSCPYAGTVAAASSPWHRVPGRVRRRRPRVPGADRRGDHLPRPGRDHRVRRGR
ncbi:hypothetical protein STENM327S_04676 [Streptomyces tendae]